MSPCISHLTCDPAYAPFTPSNSGQRSLPTYYRGCWHVVSRGLSPGISHLTCSPAYAPFTPSNSGQRSLPTYYRGCWHVVSRSFLLKYRHYRPLRQEFTIRKPSSSTRHRCIRVLHQSSLHCAIFPTAASRRSLGRVSVPMWPSNLSVRLLIVALVSRYLTN